MTNLLKFHLDPYDPEGSVRVTRDGEMYQPEAETMSMIGRVLEEYSEPSPNLDDWIPIPTWMVDGEPGNDPEEYAVTLRATNSEPSTPADILIAWQPDGFAPDPYHVESVWRLYLDDVVVLDLSQPRSDSVLPHPDYPLNSDGLIEIKGKTFKELKLEAVFWNMASSGNRTHSAFGGLFAFPAEKIRRYFPWRGDGVGLRCEACCTSDVEMAGDAWIGDFLMLYPNCIGYYDPKTHWTCHDPDHLCYVYPVGFCYPLLMFFGGGTTETAYYPKLWEGILRINGEQFNLSDPNDFWVNKNGVGIVPPQQYGVFYEGRYWSFANGHRLVEHLPDVAIFPDYDIGEPSNAYKHANAGIWIEYQHPDIIQAYVVGTTGISSGHTAIAPDSILSPKNCETYGISPAELADPETVLDRCFCCGRGFPLDWIPRRNSRRRRAAWLNMERPAIL